MQSDRALLEQQLFGTNAQPFSTDECVLEERTTLAAHHHRLDTICGLLRAPLQQPPPEATTVTLPCDALSYLRTQLPGGLWRLLKSKVPEGPTQPILVEARAELFQHVIELFVAGLEADVVFPSELFELLEGVFDGEGHSCTFYKEHGKLTPKPKKVHPLCALPVIVCRPLIQKGEEIERKFAEARFDPHRSPSIFVINAINHFGAIGGFDAAVKRIESASCSVNMMCSLVRVLGASSTHWRVAFGETFVQRLVQGVLNRLSNLSELDPVLRCLKKEELDRLLESLQATMGDFMARPKAAHVVESFSLDFSLKLLRTDMIEKRIIALNMVSEIIARLPRASAKPKNSTIWLDEKFFTTWLVRNQVVETLLGETTHAELLKRALPLLQFCQCAKLLTNEHLDSLWRLTQGNVQYVVAVVWDIVLALAETLNPNQAVYIFRNFGSIPMAQYDVPLVNMLRDFTTRALDARGSIGLAQHPQYASAYDEWFALPLLWRASLDDSGVADTLAQRCLDTLSSLLAHKHCASQRELYTQMSIDLVTSAVSVPQALAILTTIFNSYPNVAATGRAKVVTIDVFIDQLNKRLELVDVLVHEFLSYKQKFASLVQSTGSSSADCMSLRLGHHTHAQSVFSRLKFFDVMLRNSTLTLNFSQTSLIWDASITQAVDLSEKHTCLEWMIRALSRKSHEKPVFTDDVCGLIFQERLCAIEPLGDSGALLDVPFFNCFVAYFLSLNERLGHIVGMSSLTKFEVRSPLTALVGMEKLWDFVLKCNDRAVLRVATIFFIRVHVQMTPALKKHAREIRIASLQRIMELISDSAAGCSATNPVLSSSQTQMILHCLSLLTALVRGEKDVTYVAGGRCFLLLSLHIQVKETGERHVIEFSSAQTVGELRSLCASLLEYPMHLVEIDMVGGKQPLSKDGRTLDDIRSHKNQRNFTVVTNKLEEKLSAKASDPCGVDSIDPDSVAALISSHQNGQWTSQLFALLICSNSEVCVDTWELLQRIPVNPLLERKIKSVLLPSSLLSEDEAKRALPNTVTVNWPALIQPLSAGQCLYGLQIVDGLLKKHNFETAAMQELRETAMNNFVVSKGTHHLRLVLIKGLPAKQHLSPPAVLLRNRCLGVVLRLLCARPCELGVLVPASERGDTVERILSAISDASVAVADPVFLTFPQKQVADCCADTIEYAFEALIILINSERTDEIAKSSQTESIPLQAPGTQLQSSANLLQKLYQFPATAEILTKSIIDSPSTSLRRAACNGIRKFCQSYGREFAPVDGGVKYSSADAVQSKRDWQQQRHVRVQSAHPRPFFTSILLSMLPRVMTDTECKVSGTASLDYFQLLQDLLVEAARDGDPALMEAQGHAVLRDLARVLAGVQTPDSESPVASLSLDEDGKLQGVLGLIGALLRLHPSCVFSTACGARDVAEPDLSFATALMDELLNRCLFASNAKCCSPRSREAAFDALKALALSSSALLLSLAQSLNELLLPRTDGNWNVAPHESCRRDFVGLRNKGCTCYMNAIIQQLFMIPFFSCAILSSNIDIESERGSAWTAGGAQQEHAGECRSAELEADQRTSDNLFPFLKDNILFQLQRVLLYLQRSQLRFHDPADFACNFKGWDNLPVNVREQMDAQEFFNMTFDRLERELHRTLAPNNFLRSMFGGVLSNQLQCACSHRSDRDEPFYILSVEVRKRLQDSLTSFVTDELLQGNNAYLCRTCNQKVDTVKRVVLKEVPPVLLLHLKRFELDYETMRFRKLNDECSFPSVLDVEPYTVEAMHRKRSPAGSAQTNTDTVPKSESEVKTCADDDTAHEDGDNKDRTERSTESKYLYDLVGVLVHSGTAAGGHYYSFIKERPSRFGGEGVENWFEFNDTLVRPFDPADLPREAFGGVESVNAGNACSASAVVKKKTVPAQQSVEKTRSAYILFYERRGADLAQVVRVANNAEARVVTSQCGADVIPAYLQWDEKHIHCQNSQLVRDQRIHDTKLSTFMWELVSEVNRVGDSVSAQPVTNCFTFFKSSFFYDIDPVSKWENDCSFVALQALSKFVLHALARSDQSVKFSQFVHVLQHHLRLHIPACIWFARYLASDGALLNGLLRECPHPAVRGAVAELLDSMIASLVPYELDGSFIPRMKESSKRKGPIAETKSFTPDGKASELRTLAANENSSPDTAASKRITRALKKNTHPNLGGTIPQNVLDDPNAEVGVEVAATSVPSVVLRGALDEKRNEPLFNANALEKLAYVFAGSPLSALHGITNKQTKSLGGSGVVTIEQLSLLTDDKRRALAHRNLTKEMLDRSTAKAKVAMEFLAILDPCVAAPQPAPPAPPADSIPAAAATVCVPGETTSNSNSISDSVSLDPQRRVSPPCDPQRRVSPPCDPQRQVSPPSFIAPPHQCVVIRDLLARLCQISQFCRTSRHGCPELLSILLHFVEDAGARAQRKLMIEAGAIQLAAQIFVCEVPTAPAPVFSGAYVDSNKATSLQPAGADFVTVCASRFPVLAPCVQIPADTLPPFVDASVCLRLMSNLVCFGLSEELAATLFSPAEAEILYSNRFLGSLAFQYVPDSDAVPKLCASLCRGNLFVSDKLLSHVMQRIHEFDYAQFYPSLKIMQAIVSLDDVLAHERVPVALSRFVHVVEKNLLFYKATELCVSMLVQISSTTPRAAEWLVGNSHQWTFLLRWLDKHGGNPPGKSNVNGISGVVLYKLPGTDIEKEFPLAIVEITKRKTGGPLSDAKYLRQLITGSASSSTQQK